MDSYFASRLLIQWTDQHENRCDIRILPEGVGFRLAKHFIRHNLLPQSGQMGLFSLSSLKNPATTQDMSG